MRKLWYWKANSVYEDEETGLLKVLLSGQVFNWYGKSVFATIEGKRLTSLTFDLIDNFKEGLSRVAISRHGFGYVDKNMHFVIPMKYDEADDFSDGRACVKYGDRHFFIGKDGREISSTGLLENECYQEICDFSEGLCRVSTLKLRFGDLAFHSDYAEFAGVWGYINEDSEEIIAPQYIYASDFEDGIAIVAKGKWTIDPKWNNKYNSGRYWTEEELWGGIDPTGAEVIKICGTECFKSQFIALFGDPSTVQNSQYTVQDVADVQVGIVIKPTRYYADGTNGIKAFRSLNIGPMCIRDEDWVYFSQDAMKEAHRTIVHKGDVLVVRSGYPGTSCVVTDEYDGCNVIDLIIAHPYKDKILPEFLCAFTNFPHGKPF